MSESAQSPQFQTLEKTQKKTREAVSLPTVVRYLLDVTFRRPQTLGYFVFQVCPLQKWLKHNGGFKGHSNPRHPRLKPSYFKALKEIGADEGEERWLDSKVIGIDTAVETLYKKNRPMCLKLIAKTMAQQRKTMSTIMSWESKGFGGCCGFSWPQFTAADKDFINKMVIRYKKPRKPKKKKQLRQTEPQVFSCNQTKAIHAGDLTEVFSFPGFW